MFRKRIDVVFSVADQDLYIAKQIDECLKKKKITTYRYDEHDVETWGESIMRITRDMYGAKGKFLLMIISKNFPNKFWTRVEQYIAQAFRSERQAYILPLRVDNTVISGISNDIGFIKWENNPEIIAGKIIEKLALRAKRKRRKIALYTGVIIFLLIAAMIIRWQQIKEPATMGYIRKIHFPDIPGRDSIEHDRDSITQTSPVNNPVVLPSAVKKDLEINGTILDSQTGDFLDSVTVSVNRIECIAIKGFFKVTLKDVERNKHLQVKCYSSKPGYNQGSSIETPFVDNNLASISTTISMSKRN